MRRKAYNYHVKKKSEHSEKRKLRSTWKADTIKQMEIKEKIKTTITGEWENYLKSNSIAEISSKG